MLCCSAMLRPQAYTAITVHLKQTNICLPSWVDSLTLAPSWLSLATQQHQNKILCQFVVTHIRRNEKYVSFNLHKSTIVTILFDRSYFQSCTACQPHRSCQATPLLPADGVWWGEGGHGGRHWDRDGHPASFPTCWVLALLLVCEIQMNNTWNFTINVML